MSKKQLLHLVVILCLVGFTRLLPHPVNVAPMGAIALFSAASFNSNILRFGLPLLILAITDLLLVLTVNAVYTTPGQYFGSIFTYIIYLSYPLIGVYGRVAASKNQMNKPVALGAYSILGSITFFIISNFAVWAGGAYGYSIEGLISCYVAAIPFFHHSILGDLFYNSVLFGLFYSVKTYVWKTSFN